MQWNNNKDKYDKNDTTKNTNTNKNNQNNEKKHEDVSITTTIPAATTITTTTVTGTNVAAAASSSSVIPYRRPTVSVSSNSSNGTNNNNNKVLLSQKRYRNNGYGMNIKNDTYQQHQQQPPSYSKHYQNVRGSSILYKHQYNNNKRKSLGVIEIFSILLVTSIILWILFLILQYIVLQSVIVSTKTTVFPLTLVERLMLILTKPFGTGYNQQQNLLLQQKIINELLQQKQFSKDLQYFTQISLCTNSNTTTTTTNDTTTCTGTTTTATIINVNSSIVLPETIQIRHFLQDVYDKMNNDCNRTTNNTVTRNTIEKTTNKMYYQQYNNDMLDMLDMTNLRYSMNYDATINGGGVWKQGFPLQPLLNLSSISSTKSETQNETTRIKLKIFVMPHTHIDPILVEEHSQVQKKVQRHVQVKVQRHVQGHGGYKQYNKIKTSTPAITYNNGVDMHNDTKVFKILSNVIDSLINNPRRTFVWNDIHSLEWFYRTISTSAGDSKSDNNNNNNNDKKRYRMTIQNLHTIIQNKQFEIVTGNWIGTSDTAILNINTIEINIQEGLIWLYETFKIQPQYALLLGSSGFSSTINQLYSSYQYYKYKGIVLHNIHYNIKKFLATKKFLEFNWISSTQPIVMSDTTNTVNSSFFKLSALSNEKFIFQTNVDYTTTTTINQQQQQQQCYDNQDDNNNSNGILTHIMPFFAYDISHTCGPDPSICCQFDFELLEERKYNKLTKNKNVCSWGIDPILITDTNVKIKAELLINQYLQKASLYRYNTLLVPLGGNLKYYYNSNIQYTNYEKLFEYINNNFPEIHIQFGTLEQYFNEIRSNQRKQQQQQQQQTHVKLERKQTTVQSIQNTVVPKIYGSFFPYADLDDNYKTTYYSQSTISRTMIKQLERLLYVAETFLRIDNLSLTNLISQQKQKLSSTLLLNIDDISYARKTLSLFCHHDIVQSTSPRGSTIDKNSMNKYKWKINHATKRMSQWIKNQFISLLLHSPLSLSPTGKIDFNHIQRINETMIYCGSFSNFLIDETDVYFQCDKRGGGNDFVVYNPLSQANQYLCNGTITIGPNQFVKVQLPCPEDLNHHNNTSQTPMESLVKFNASTGLFMEPFVEEWKGLAKVKNIVDGKFRTVLYDYIIKGQQKETAISNNIYHVDTPTWTRSAIERHNTTVLTEKYKKLILSYKVIDLYYQTVQKRNTQLPDIYVVRLGLSNLTNNGLLFADVNGNNIEQYKYRPNDNNNSNNHAPYQSQLVPISSLVYIQNSTTRITIISDQGHGVMSPINGFIDIQLNRGAINSVTESNTIATTIRVVIEQTSDDIIMFTNDYPVTELVQRLWDEIQHPLELFGVRISNEDTTASDGTSLQIRQKGAPSSIHKMMKKQKITITKYNPNNTYVPFVFMVFNRVGYFMKAIESLRQSDFPFKTVPIIISQDGHVPEMSDFVSSLKNEFKVIHLYHPYSCYDRKDTFPGGNDTMLNIGYTGDSYGHTREGKVTCCKHHFTWLLQKVFSLSMEELYGPDITMTASPNNTFFFTEEDYEIGPTIYDSIASGLNAIEEYQGTVISGKGIFGLTFEASMLSAKYARSYDFWYVYSFKSGPMTINREMFNRIKKHSQLYCNFDDYNWDWSLVNLQDCSDNVPRIVLAPSMNLVKHIGLQEGLHYDPNKARNIARKRPTQLSKMFNGLYFRDSIETRPMKNRSGYGGWGHPIDQNHCKELLK